MSRRAETRVSTGSDLEAVHCRQLFEETEAEVAAEAAASKKGGKSAFKLNSVGAQFRKQLQGLMATLNQCQPHYIRSATDPPTLSCQT